MSTESGSIGIKWEKLHTVVVTFLRPIPFSYSKEPYGYNIIFKHDVNVVECIEKIKLALKEKKIPFKDVRHSGDVYGIVDVIGSTKIADELRLPDIVEVLKPEQISEFIPEVHRTLLKTGWFGLD